MPTYTASAVALFLGYAVASVEAQTTLPPAYADNPNKKCTDVTSAAQDPVCYTNVTWAMMTGITKHPAMYKNFSLTSASSRMDFQCALSSMVGPDQAGTGHACPVPCSSNLARSPLAVGYRADVYECIANPTPAPTPLPTVASAGVMATPPPTTPETFGAGFQASTAAPGGGESMPTWAWILIALTVIAIGAGGVAFFVFAGKKKQSRESGNYLQSDPEEGENYAEE